MRMLSVTLLLALLVPAAPAQEGTDVTAQLPKGTPFSFRVASFDRVDALVKEWVPILKALGLGAQVAPLEEMKASDLIFVKSGLSAEIVDRTKPIYLGFFEHKETPVVVLHPAPGAAWEGKKELREGAFAIVRGGAIVAAEAGLLDAEVRGTPTTFRVDGDAVFHVYLGDLVAEHKAEIEQGATEASMGIAASIPEQARPLVLPLVTSVKNAVLSLDSFDYGATWTGERLETEGFLAVQEGSGLRSLLKRAGEPGTTDLVGYLPKEAYLTISTSMNADWPTKEMKDLLQAAGGADVAAAVMQIMSMGSAFDASRTGRTAAAVNMSMMSATVLTLTELKPGTDAKLIETFDVTKMNDALKRIGLPMTYSLEKAAAKHKVQREGEEAREVELYRLGITSEDPNMAMMFAAMQGCLAVDKDILFMSMSPTAEDDIKALLDKVNKGEKDAEHPHTKAMARLGRGCNIGFTINLGALKPMAMMFGMMGMPAEVGQVIQAVPDVFPLSTAVTFPDGNVRWRGDWPVKEAVKIAEAVVGTPTGGEAPAPKPEDEGDDDEKFD